MDLASFDRQLRDLTKEDPRVRPFVCDGSPLHCRIVIAGLNPATDMPFWPYWNARTGFDRKAWYEAYLGHRANRTPSTTRRRTDRAVRSVYPAHCVETNLYPTASPRLSELPTRLRTTDVFDFLIAAVRPVGLLVHGADAVRHIQPRCSGPISKLVPQVAEFEFGKVLVLGGNHLTRFWKDAEIEAALRLLVAGDGIAQLADVDVPRHEGLDVHHTEARTPSQDSGDSTRSQAALLAHHFERVPRTGWDALSARVPLHPSFRTQRVAKLKRSILLFTIGETDLGRSHGLDRQIRQIIEGVGVRVKEEPSTSGSLARPKMYVGLNLTTCSTAQLQTIVERVMATLYRVGE